jgi:hypothetical protein
MASGEPTCGPRRGDGKFVGRQSGDRARLRHIKANALPQKRSSVAFPGLRERGPNQTKQSRVLQGAIRERLVQPLVVAARRHFQHAAQHLHAGRVTLRLDEFVGRADAPELVDVMTVTWWALEESNL